MSPYPEQTANRANSGTFRRYCISFENYVASACGGSVAFVSQDSGISTQNPKTSTSGAPAICWLSPALEREAAFDVAAVGKSTAGVAFLPT